MLIVICVVVHVVGPIDAYRSRKDDEHVRYTLANAIKRRSSRHDLVFAYPFELMNEFRGEFLAESQPA